MDLFLRYGQNTTTWDGFLDGSDQIGFTGPEFIFVPNVVNYPAYGLSYTYYDGTFHKLDFTVTFIEFANGVAEPTAQQQAYNATYTLANKNTWTDYNTTLVVQTFEKAGGGFSNPSAITVPAAGSRVAPSGHFTAPIKRGEGTVSTSKLIQSLFKKK
jgi:hypothetical protein